MAAPVDPGDFTNAPLLSTPVAAPYKVDADLYDARFLVLYRALDKAAVGLDAFSVQDGIVTPALIEAQSAWSTVALGGGATWSPATLSYRKDSAGRVLVKPLIYTLTVANLVAPVAIATLPAGFRPGVKSYFTGNIPSNGGTTAHVAFSIATNGVMTLESSTAFIDSGGAQRVIFPGIEFRAEN